MVSKNFVKIVAVSHYRLLQQYKECGLTVPSSTVNDWFNKTCDLMRLLYNALRRELMKVKYIHCDETAAG